MIGYLARRIGWAVLTLFGVCLFTYAIFFLLSPDPASLICGQTCNPERIATIRDQLGIDEPFWVQFGTFLLGLVVGRSYGEGASAVHCAAPCLGHSFQNGQNVGTMIGERIEVTITVAVGASIIWLLWGLLSGVL